MSRRKRGKSKCILQALVNLFSLFPLFFSLVPPLHSLLPLPLFSLFFLLCRDEERKEPVPPPSVSSVFAFKALALVLSYFFRNNLRFTDDYRSEVRGQRICLRLGVVQCHILCLEMTVSTDVSSVISDVWSVMCLVMCDQWCMISDVWSVWCVWWCMISDVWSVWCV